MAAPDAEPPVRRVPVPVDTRAPGGTTNAYVAGGLLVDPAARSDALDAAVGVGDSGEDGVAVDAIAVTHTHPDHVGAVAAYAGLAGVPVFAHADHVDRFVAATGVEPDGTFEDGERVGATDVRAVDTPGHASDHVAFAVEEARENGGDEEPSRALLCGDLAVADGSVVVGAPDGDLREYLDSLRRVREAEYDRLYPGHGPVIDDPEARAAAYWAGYGVAQSAVRALAAMLAAECRAHGPSVTTVDPGKFYSALRSRVWPAENPGELPTAEAAAETVLAELDRRH